MAKIEIETTEFEYVVLVPKYADRVGDLKDIDRATLPENAISDDPSVYTDWQKKVRVYRRGALLGPLKSLELLIDSNISDYPIWKENVPRDYDNRVSSASPSLQTH